VASSRACLGNGTSRLCRRPLPTRGDVGIGDAASTSGRSIRHAPAPWLDQPGGPTRSGLRTRLRSWGAGIAGPESVAARRPGSRCTSCLLYAGARRSLRSAQSVAHPLAEPGWCVCAGIQGSSMQADGHAANRNPETRRAWFDAHPEQSPTPAPQGGNGMGLDRNSSYGAMGAPPRFVAPGDKQQIGQCWARYE
jgi:hypothetical protein